MASESPQWLSDFSNRSQSRDFPLPLALFDRIIDSELSRSIRFRQPLSLILLDVDRFAGIDARLGRATSDAVLQELVNVVRGRMRGADLLFRWTADEFVVLAPSTGYRGAAVLAEDLRARVEQHAFANAGRLTVSAGVSEHRESESAPAWFKRLDEALSAAKSAGRNCVRAAQGGSSNLWAAAKGPAALSLSWQEAYECGEPTIDREHRELFELGNLLLDAAGAGTTDYASIQAPLGNLLALVQKHFADEEALLAKHGYAHVELHQQAHDRLLVRAEALRAAAEAGDGTLGAVTEFLAGEVIARHILATDRDYYHLFQPASALPRR